MKNRAKCNKCEDILIICSGHSHLSCICGELNIQKSMWVFCNDWTLLDENNKVLDDSNEK